MNWKKKQQERNSLERKRNKLDNGSEVEYAYEDEDGYEYGTERSIAAWKCNFGIDSLNRSHGHSSSHSSESLHSSHLQL
jgi:hypothetical protein